MSDQRNRKPDRAPSQSEGQQPPADAPPKREDEMSKGKGYKLHTEDARFEYDPAKHRAREEGGEPG